MRNFSLSRAALSKFLGYSQGLNRHTCKCYKSKRLLYQRYLSNKTTPAEFGGQNLPFKYNMVLVIAFWEKLANSVRLG
jgi:hypothetical protein